MQTYKVVLLTGKSADEDLEKELNRYSQEGWELFSIIGDLGVIKIVLRKTS